MIPVLVVLILVLCLLLVTAACLLCVLEQNRQELSEKLGSECERRCELEIEVSRLRGEVNVLEWQARRSQGMSGDTATRYSTDCDRAGNGMPQSRPAARARFTSEGGLSSCEDFPWTASAEEEFTRRLTALSQQSTCSSVTSCSGGEHMGQQISPQNRDRMLRNPHVHRLTCEHVILKDGRVLDPGEFIMEQKKVLFVMKLLECNCFFVRHQVGFHALVAGVVNVFGTGREENVPGPPPGCSRGRWIIEEVVAAT